MCKNINMFNFLLIALAFVKISALHSNQLGNIARAKVFRVFPEDEKALDYLQTTLGSDVADFWTKPRQIGDSVDFMTLDWMVPVMKNMLKKVEIPFEIVKEDVEEDLKEHLKEVKNRAKESLDWSTYYSYEHIVAWLEKVRLEFPSSVFVKAIGQTSEGRDIMLAKLSRDDETEKPAIWINAGIYGREWISPATATLLIERLLAATGDDSLLSKYDFFFVPVANPDGYIYSWTDVRLWSKSRLDEKLANGCVGVDLNRNWNITWNGLERKNNPCLNNNPGKAAFSEPETQALKEAILGQSSSLKAFLSLEAFGQKWLSACSYSGFEAPCKDLDILGERLAAASSSGKKRRKYEYVEGSPMVYKYTMSGTSVAWAKFVVGIKYSYALELPDTGSFGYFLHPDEITSVGEETYLALVELLNYINKGTQKDEL